MSVNNRKANVKALVLSIALGMLPTAVVEAADPEIAVIGNPAAQSMTKDQVADLFLGKSQGMKLLDLPNSAPIKAAFYQKVSGHDLSQVKATWSRLIFTGRGQPPKELPDDAAVKKAVAADPKAIGYIEKSQVDSSVKILLTLN
jgi:ABC-type phosphate transport system substrate-binding protein